MNYYTIPEIGGRLLVGGPEWDAPSHVTYWINVLRDIRVAKIPDNYYLEGSESADSPEQDLERRAAALGWYMAKSQQAGSVFYIFSPPRAWEMTAMCLMARYGWTKKRCSEIIPDGMCALDDHLYFEEIDFDAAEKGYKLWLEKGSNHP